MTDGGKRQAGFVAESAEVGGERPANGERLSDVAYRAILQGLFDQKVPAGAFVSQNDLVRLLGIPVQPLRDALRVLEAEGVLTIHPRSGIQFLKPDLELARSTYQFRSIIERAAARRYAETGDAERARDLIAGHKALMARIEKEGLTDGALEALEVLEVGLHGSMIANMKNPLIETTAQRLKNYVTLIRLDRLVTAPLALRTLGEHLEILEAFVARDPDRAEAAIASHFQAALQRILGMF
ncbi:GntR family transcriptional regulator [Sphingopyxis panaciterrulae]|uniref:DNA-binding GntR family transcriptional regulator n=1 Tax=Sphingopyxis panaciterrulae TaxID=462372 RepID=A0A7W9B3Q7_9SPHN|nr:GntR family transcriptional regulator [Sphingopyxis panaciterrulae]MBB5705729.1 DNA-binding GntR family transcriptional regulator [Sphingopyxis panaciterrulae]